MHNLLARLLEKRGIKDVSKLETEPIIPGLPSEQKEFENWNLILTQTITVDKIAEFCKNQIKQIESQWKNLDNTVDKNQRLILLHIVYSTIHDIILSPSKEKEDLERYLQSLLK